MMIQQRCRKYILLSILCLTSLKAKASTEDVSLTPKVLIDNIEANERLYSNIDVSVEHSYVKKYRQGLMKEHILDSNLKFQFVNQNNYYRHSTDKTQLDNSGRKPERHRDMMGYDGEKTRMLMRRPAPPGDDRKESTIANIRNGRENIGIPFCPHTELIPKYTCRLPLSVFLRGGQILKNHPNAEDEYRSGKWENRFSVIGRERVRDLDCVKIRIEIWGTVDNKVNTLFFLWLAEERNYIPIQSNGFLYRASIDKPISEAVADKFQQVSQGVWLPMHFRQDVYDLRSLMEGGKQVLSNVEDWTVQKVSLEPNYDVAFFRDIQFPPATLVYEVNNGNITTSYRTEGNPERESSDLWRWWPYIVGTIALCGGLWLSRKHRLRKQEQVEARLMRS